MPVAKADLMLYPPMKIAIAGSIAARGEFALHTLPQRNAVFAHYAG